MPPARHWHPRIRTVLLIVHLAILILPLFGIQALRLYENELVRQTEGSLIAQGAYIREHAKQLLIDTYRSLSPTPVEPSSPAPTSESARVIPATAGLPLSLLAQARQTAATEPFDPIQPTLDVAHERLRPPAEDAISTPLTADLLLSQAGARLSHFLARTQRHTLMGVRVVDHQGIVVASSRGEMGLSIAHREEVERALRGETLSLLRMRISDEPPPPLVGLSRSTGLRVFFAMPLIVEDRLLGAVVLSRTPMDLEKALYLNRFVLARYGLGLLVIMALVSLLTATTISRPIKALIHQARAVGADPRRAAAPLTSPGSREIRELSEAVAGMAKALQERASYIKTLAQNISHEFKTPLGGILGVTEILKDHFLSMSSEERLKFLSLIERDATRLRHLVEKLLALARADTLSPEVDQTYSTLEPILSSLQDRLQAHTPPMALSLALGEEARLPLAMPGEALETVLQNILENARQHGGPGVFVTLSARVITRRSKHKMLVIQCSDTGAGISPANLPRIFDPFFTTARENGGTGLGLPLVKSLIEAYGGSIQVESPPPVVGPQDTPSQGTLVTIEIPCV